MSDPFDTIFEGLRGQRPPAPFAPAAAVRRRGRQRAQRQAASVGVAVFVVTGLGAGGIVATLGDSQSPVVPASPPASVETPAGTEVPARWLLTADDLPGAGWQQDTGELMQGAWYWDGAEAWCPEYRLADYPSVQRRLSFDSGGWRREGEALPERVDQAVERYEPGAGPINVDDVRAYLDRCSRRPAEGDQVASTYYEIEETGFAGDESMLIRVEEYAFVDGENIGLVGEPLHVAVVRVGDVVTTIRYLNLRDDAVPIAQRAAALLG